MANDLTHVASRAGITIVDISRIYDPDIHSPDDMSDYIVAAPGSFVWVGKVPHKVVALDSVTLKATIEPTDLPTSAADEQGGGLLEYSNDRFLLLYSEADIPHRLNVEGKLVFHGTDHSEYRLKKTMSDGSEKIISMRLDGDGEVISDRVPMLQTQAGYRICADCHTTHVLEDGDRVMLETFSPSGDLRFQIRLVAKKSHNINDVSSSINPITELRVNANQESGDDWLLYRNQSIEDLTLYPELVFSDRSSENVAFDGNRCVIYGLEAVDPKALVGRRFPVTCKYFLSDIQQSLSSADTLAISKFIRIESVEHEQISRIMVLPVWNNTSLQWNIRVIAYYESRKDFEDVTSRMVITSDYSGGRVDGSQQDLLIRIDPPSDRPELGDYEQGFTMRYNLPTDEEPFVIQSKRDPSCVYGIIDVLARPTIVYNDSTKEYAVSSTRFPTKESFLDAFYEMSDPPFNTSEGETKPPTPTHFAIRSVEPQVGTLLIASPIDIENYTQGWTVLVDEASSAAVGSTVVLEFLIQDGDNYDILYGVPVEIKSAT